MVSRQAGEHVGPRTGQAKQLIMVARLIDEDPGCASTFGGLAAVALSPGSDPQNDII
ncbi:MAG: hypothetical protein ACRC0L_00640 [Angustibacter sp.]